MLWFKSKCKHPMNDLLVESYKAEVGPSFTKHTIKYICLNCNKLIDNNFTTFTKGVESFLESKGDYT